VKAADRAKAGLKRLAGPLERLARSPAARIGLSLAIVAIAAWLIRQELRDVRFSSVMSALGRTRPLALLAAVGCSVASYACMALVEALALKFIGKPLPPARVAGASAIANALSIAMGFGLASGTAVRLRVYSFADFGAADAAKLVLVLSVCSFAGGMVALGASVLASPAPIVHALGWTEPLVIALAAALLTPAALWFVLLRKRRPNLDWRQRALALLATLGGNWLFGGLGLFALSPHGLNDLPPFLATFFVGGLVGSAIGVPADLGVLEASVLSLKSLGAAHQTAAALIVYRIIFQVIPLAIATVVFGWRQVIKLGRGARQKAV
jgi:phosphatidylglycerol lysyltransferase